MKTVWKFPIKIVDDQVMQMPAGAEIIHAGVDPAGAPCVWAKVEPGVAPQDSVLFLSGTGQPIPDGGHVDHVGTFRHYAFVWHVWTPCA